MSGETKVETQALKQAADALVGLRGDTDRVDNDPMRDVVDAAQGLNKSGTGDGQWETSEGLLKMSDRFRDSVGNLKSLLGDISDNIHETHKGYTKAEQAERDKYAAHNPYDIDGNRSMYHDFG